MRLNMVTGVSPAPARLRNGLPRRRVQVQSDTQKVEEPFVLPASYWGREGRGGRGVCKNGDSRDQGGLAIVSFDSPIPPA